MKQNPPISAGPIGSFLDLSNAAFASHMSRRIYGSFCLPEAIRPSYDLKVLPEEGFRYDVFTSEDGRNSYCVVAAASCEKLLPLFADLLSCLHKSVEVWLETHHDRECSSGHESFVVEGFATEMLESYLGQFEDLLLHDGFFGICVVDRVFGMEIQFDEHKVLTCYAPDPGRFETILSRHGVNEIPDIKFIYEAEHVHQSNKGSRQRFREFLDLVRRAK